MVAARSRPCVVQGHVLARKMSTACSAMCPCNSSRPSMSSALAQLVGCSAMHCVRVARHYVWISLICSHSVLSLVSISHVGMWPQPLSARCPAVVAHA
jgi:hypothetical protein